MNYKKKKKLTKVTELVDLPQIPQSTLALIPQISFGTKRVPTTTRGKPTRSTRLEPQKHIKTNIRDLVDRPPPDNPKYFNSDPPRYLSALNKSLQPRLANREGAEDLDCKTKKELTKVLLLVDFPWIPKVLQQQRPHLSFRTKGVLTTRLGKLITSRRLELQKKYKRKKATELVDLPRIPQSTSATISQISFSTARVVLTTPPKPRWSRRLKLQKRKRKTYEGDPLGGPPLDFMKYLCSNPFSSLLQSKESL